jgi:HTH-type transcriptional regulator/antitoxin HigA
MSASANATVDEKKYARLLTRALPSVIKTESEYGRALREVERLMDKGEESLSPEEDALLELMVKLVQDYEDEHHAIPDAAPHEVLQHLMEARGLKQADMLPVFGSRGYTSDIVRGKRGISKEHAKALGEFFHVSPSLFI